MINSFIGKAEYSNEWSAIPVETLDTPMDFPLIRKKSLKAMSFVTFNSRQVFYHQLNFGFFAVGLFVDMVYSLEKKHVQHAWECV